jgi:peptide-methionine (S)-S-oxide reductase
MARMDQSTETALFALGNFWEPEYEFGKLPGVVHVESGYTGGTSNNPSYHNIGDHAETIQVEFDPHRISYEQLLDKFWSKHDPTAEYEARFRSAVFYLDETQRRLAEASKNEAQEHFNQPIVTEIVPAGKFYPAESYNQDYLAKLKGEI